MVQIFMLCIKYGQNVEFTKGHFLKDFLIMILVNNDDWFKFNDLNGLFFCLKWTSRYW